MRLPNPYSLEETLSKLRHRLATACNEEALALLEKAVTKARDDEGYALSLIHISEPTRRYHTSRMPSSA